MNFIIGDPRAERTQEKSGKRANGFFVELYALPPGQKRGSGTTVSRMNSVFMEGNHAKNRFIKNH